MSVGKFGLYAIERNAIGLLSIVFSMQKNWAKE